MSPRSTFDRLSIIRALDQLLWPSALILARLLAKIPRRRDNTSLIIRPGGMGDLISFHIALEQLGLDPKRFLWIIEKRSLPWVRHMNLPYKLIEPKLLLSVGRYRHIINSEQHYGVSQIIAVALAGRGRNLTALSTVRGANVATSVCPYSPIHTHEIDSFRKLLMVAEKMRGHEQELIRVRSHPEDGSLVVALGGGHAESRSLELGQWIEIIGKWAGSQRFFVIAGPVETQVAEDLAKCFEGQGEFIPGDFSENCKRISTATRVLTMDGGLTHVANYFGVPTDTLFTSGQELLWGPTAEGSRAFFDRELACRPCTMFGHTPTCQVGFLCKDNLINYVEPAEDKS